MAEESQLSDALEEEVMHSLVLMDEIEATRTLLMEVIRTISNHQRIGYSWRTLFDPKLLGKVEMVRMGNYLTEEMEDGEARHRGTQAGDGAKEEPEDSEESLQGGDTEILR